MAKKPLQLVMLISGSGTTMEAIIKSTLAGKLKNYLKPVLVISSKATAPGLNKAAQLNIPTKVVTRESLAHLGEVLKYHRPDIITQNGWLLKTPEDVIKIFRGRLFNQHPGPIEFGGRGMYGLHVHAAVCRFQYLSKRLFPTEATIHAVEPAYDSGNVVWRVPVAVKNEDTPETLQQRVLPVEHQAQIDFLQTWCQTNGRLKALERLKPLIAKTETALFLRAMRYGKDYGTLSQKIPEG